MYKGLYRIFVFSVLTFSLFLSSRPVAAQGYRIEDLGTLGRDYSAAYGINDDGEVVGWSDPAEAPTHAFLYTSAGDMVDLGALPGGSYSFAFAINNVGQVVGSAVSDVQAECPVLWTDGRLEILPGVDEACEIRDSNARAVAINDAGQIVIKIYRGAGFYQSKRRESDGRLTDLGNLIASGINQYGQVAGTTNFVVLQAQRYTDGIGREFLGTLGGGQSDAEGINDWGQVVGTSSTPDGSWHAFRYTDKVGMEDLGTLPGYSSNDALAINNAGVTVGFASSGITRRAFVYTDGEGMRNLNDLINDPNWVLLEARGINNAGQIVGAGMYQGHRRAFRLTPMEK